MAHADDQLDDLMDSIREAHRNRSPRAIARDELGRAFRVDRGPATDLYGPLTRAAFKNCPPLPDGYVPSTRRS